jgi:hypothetical protein
MSDPIDDQRATAERHAVEFFDDYSAHVRETTDRVRRHDGRPSTDAVAEMVADFQRRASGPMLACPHLHERPIQPTFWVACEPDRLSCRSCAGAQAARLSRELFDTCDRCGRLDDDLTQVSGVLGRFNLRGYFCERCHPTGL